MAESELLVKLPSGKAIDLSTESLLTIKDVKAKLEYTEGIRREYQSLVHAEDILEDDTFLADCNLNNSIIQLVVSSTQESIIVFVRGDFDETVVIDVQLDQTISLLKEKIELLKEVSLQDQEIVFNGCCLEDGHTVAHYCIPHKAILYLLPHRSRAMQILVRISATNKIIELKIKATDEISEIKAKIHKKEHSIPPDEQLLIYEDELLKDQYTASKCNIGHLSMLDLLIKGRKVVELIATDNKEKVEYESPQQPKVDLYEAVMLTGSLHSYWEEFGGLLGIREEKLKDISLKYQTEPRYLYEILRYWVKTPVASWEKLAKALKHPLISRKDLANKVEEKHIRNQSESSSDEHVNILKNDKPFDENSKVCLSDIYHAKVDWKVLGLLLGLSDDILKNIEGKSLSVDECQKLMIDQWISTGQARWSTLLNALKGPLLCNIRLAHKLAKKYLGQKLFDEEVLPGTIPVDKEKIKEKQLVIANVLQSYPKQTGKQPKGIIFIFGMSAEVEGVTVDVENVRKTFQDDLEFAVLRVENMTCSELAAIIEAAAKYKGYPNRTCKFKCFYFAGHGGVDEQRRPFFKPISKAENEIFLIRENVLSRFKNIGGSHKFIFFFDCCLNSTYSNSLDCSQSFGFEPPTAECLVAYATHKGYKAHGDKVEGGRYTSVLCKRLKEKAELCELLGKTYEEVKELSKKKLGKEFKKEAEVMKEFKEVGQEFEEVEMKEELEEEVGNNIKEEIEPEELANDIKEVESEEEMGNDIKEEVEPEEADEEEVGVANDIKKVESEEEMGNDNKEEVEPEEADEVQLQLPQFHSCSGPIYLKGIPEKYKNEIINLQAPSNPLQQNRDPLMKYLCLNITDYILLVAYLFKDGIISEQKKNQILKKSESSTKEGASILLTALEKRVDDCPGIFDKIFQQMQNLSVNFHGLATKLKKSADATNSTSRSTLDLLNEAYDSAKRNELKYKQEVKEWDKLMEKAHDEFEKDRKEFEEKSRKLEMESKETERLLNQDFEKERKQFEDNIQELKDKMQNMKAVVEKYGYHCEQCMAKFHVSSDCLCCRNHILGQ